MEPDERPHTAPRGPLHPTLQPRVVRPPQLSEGKVLRLPHQGRTSACRPRPHIRIKEDFKPLPSAVVIASPSAQASALRPHAPVEIDGLHLPSVETWPSAAASRLIVALQRKLAEADRYPGNYVLRANVFVETVRIMSHGMPTYGSVLETIASEMQALITKIEDAGADAEQAKAEAHAARAETNAIVGAQQMAFNDEREAWRTTRDSRDEQLETAVRDALTMRKRLADVSAELDGAKKSHDEVINARLNFETMATQFAQRNKSLTEKVADLEHQLETATRRAEQMTAANYAYSQRVTNLEQAANGDSVAHKLALNKLQDALDAANQRIRQLQSTTSGLKDTLAKSERLLGEAKQERDEALARQEAMGVAHTPRPTFRHQDDVYFGRLQSTSNRYDAMSDALGRLSERLEDALSDMAALARAAYLGRIADVTVRPLQSKIPAVVLAAAGTRIAGKVPPYLVTLSPSVKVPALTLRDAVVTARTFFTVHADLEKRMGLFGLGSAVGRGAATVPFVEMHCAVLHYHQDQIPQQQLITEANYRVFSIASQWANNPIVRLFGAVLREEMAAWVYHVQNRVAVRLMRGLSTCVGSTITTHKHVIAAVLRAEKFADAAIAVVQHHFMNLYAHGNGGDESSGAIAERVTRASAAASVRTDTLPMDDLDGVVVDEDETCCHIVYDETRHNPASQVTIVELPIISVLRRVHMERLATFYYKLDRELAWQATGKLHATEATLMHAYVASTRVFVLALENVVPGITEADAATYANQVFTLCAATLTYERNATKLNKKEIESTGAVISNRALPLAGLQRWYSPYFVAPPKPTAHVPEALLAAVGEKSLAGQNDRRGPQSSPAAAKALLAETAVNSVKEQLLCAGSPVTLAFDSPSVRILDGTWDDDASDSGSDNNSDMETDRVKSSAGQRSRSVAAVHTAGPRAAEAQRSRRPETSFPLSLVLRCVRKVEFAPADPLL
jgi:hypothetical protein